MALQLPYLDQGTIIGLLQKALGVSLPQPAQDPLSAILDLHRRRMAALQPEPVQPTFGPQLQPGPVPAAQQPTFGPTLQPSFAPVDQPVFEPTLEPVNTVQPGLRPAPQKQQPAIYRQEPTRGLVGLLRPRVR